MSTKPITGVRLGGVDLLNRIMAYEDGELDGEQVLGLFAELLRSGLAWQLQGAYGRAAARLIQKGWLSPQGEVVRHSVEAD